MTGAICFVWLLLCYNKNKQQKNIQKFCKIEEEKKKRINVSCWHVKICQKCVNEIKKIKKNKNKRRNKHTKI